MESKDEKNEMTHDKKEHNYIKNLCYDIDSGKITINDSENNKYKSDIFGRKRPKFLPNITGIRNRYINYEKSRQKHLLDLKINSYKSVNNTFDNNKKDSNYTPTIRKFEGYSKFPRPKGPPFLNIPPYELKENQKRKVIEDLNNYFNEDLSVKNDIIRKNENKGLSYLTRTLNEYDIMKNDTKKLQKLIKNNLEEIKLKYQLKQNLYKKDNIVKALNQFNIKLSENKNSKTINGRILNEPHDKIKRYFKIINTMIKNKKNYSQDKTYIKRKINKLNIKLISEDNNKDIINNNKNKDFTLGKIIKLDFGISIEKEKLPEIKNNIEEKEENKDEEIKVEINDENNIINNSVDNNDIHNENNNIDNNENNKEENIQEEKIRDNEISFISDLSENGKKYYKKNDLKIKSINRINNKTENENKLLEGYIEEPIEETKIFQKQRPIRLKTEGDLYMDNINLLKLTNKTAFLIQEKKDLYDLQLLKKKIRNQTININNAMRIKNKPKIKKK